MKAMHFSFLDGRGGGVELQLPNGDHLEIVVNRNKGPRALKREAARRLRCLANALDAETWPKASDKK